MLKPERRELMKRTCSVILLMLLLIPTVLLTACGGEDGPAQAAETTEAVTETEAPETTAPSNASVIAQRYDSVDYDGYVFRILSPSVGKHFYRINGSADLENEIYIEKLTGSNLYDAIYERNLAAEELLNIKIEPVYGGENTDVTTKVRSSILAGDDAFDLVLNRFDYLLNLAAEKLLVNYCDVSGIDVSDPWWYQNMVRTFTLFHNALYTLAGDYNFYDDYAASVVFFNKKMTADMGYVSPYQKVRDDSWLMDYFMKTANEVTADLNGDGKLTTADDRWGYGISSSGIQNFIQNFGLHFTEIDENGEIAIVYNEKMVQVVDLLYQFMNVNERVFVENTYGKVFADGRKMFYADTIGNIGKLRDMEDDFGIVPLPKGDESLDNYTAYVSNGWTTAVSIPITAADISRSAIVFDAMSAFSTDTVAVEFFEVMLKEKYIRDEDSKEMLPIIMQARQYDWAGDLAWSSSLRTLFYDLTKAPSNNYVSKMEAMLPSLEAKLSDMMEAYR